MDDFCLISCFHCFTQTHTSANGWGGLRPEICENLVGKSEKIIDFWIAKRRGRGENLRKIIVFASIRNRTICTLSSRYSFRSTNLPRKSVFNGDNGWRLSPMEWWWLKSDNAGLYVAPKRSAQTWRENIFSGNYCIIKIYCIFAASLRIFLKNPQRYCGNFVRYVP